MNPNSALYWLPRLQAAGLPIPRTEVVPVPLRAFWAVCDNIIAPDLDVPAMKAAAARIGFPCFVRSDQSSAKHDGPRAYRADSETDVLRTFGATAEDNICKGMDPEAMLYREWLNLDAPFCAFDGHPIAREWRYFVSPGRIHCVHFYWPEEAIHGADHEDWASLLAGLHEQGIAERAELDVMAVTAGEALIAAGEAWSVDFARDRAGKWWLIDCALAAHSWHPETCPNAVPLRRGAEGGDANHDAPEVPAP